ncbi:MAG: class I tRNA ligase family protein, partial [Lachnospiraceae bacterium]|nr:class I tRNA ligase family protein [Lachnospiraceae bacterium]
YGAAAPWNDSSTKGCKRFLERVAALTDMITDEPISKDLETKLHQTIKKVTHDIEEMKFNTAIASLMGLINDIYAVGKLDKESVSIIIRLLCPFAPHICEEMWETIGGEGYASLAAWPEYDEAKTVNDTIEIGVQVNGKLRSTIVIPTGADKDTVLGIAKDDEKIKFATEGKTIVKEIYVPNKIVNLVVK